MKILFRSFFITSIFLIGFSSCTAEPEELREYPVLTTLDVTEIDETGVTFTAEIKFRRNKILEKHGFVWGPKPRSPKVGTGKFEVIIDGTPENDKFTIRVNEGLDTGSESIVRAFVIQDSLIIYGDEKSFTSPGGTLP